MINLLNTEKECIEYIHSAGRFGKKAGLCNIKALLNTLGNPHKDLKCIHIAGTNGKGSVSCMLTNILMQAGYKVGMNTSPYIEVFNERLTINGVNIPSDKLVYYTNLVAEAIEKLNDVHPIEFEIITAIGFLYFKEENCDYCVIECGIGGLMDSTNVIEDPALCIITRLGLDHTDILGDTLEQIALQKAGIIKTNSTVVVHPDTEKEVFGVIKDYADKKGAKCYLADSDYAIIDATLDYTDITIDSLTMRLKLLGSFQASNAALAVFSANKLGIDDAAIVRGMENTRWKCRFERVRERVIIDGAHNICGVEAFCQSADMYLSDKNRIFVIGMLNDKDFEECAKRLSALKGTFVVTDVPSARQTETVYHKIRKFIPDALYEANYKKAVDKAIAISGEDGFVCALGSLYLAGAVRTYLS